jgi:acyl-CoA thioesterase-1
MWTTLRAGDRLAEIAHFDDGGGEETGELSMGSLRKMTMFKPRAGRNAAGPAAAGTGRGKPGGESQAGGKGPVLVVGDSLSAAHNIPAAAGWVSLLDLRLKRDMKTPPAVVNASMSGETSAGALTRLPALLAKHGPSVVVIELGGNDALRGGAGATAGNLARMVELSQAAGAKVLLVGIDVPPNYGPAYRARLKATYAELAAPTTALLPFLLEGVALQPGMLQADGLHPVAAAQPKLLDNVWPVLGLCCEAGSRELDAVACTLHKAEEWRASTMRQGEESVRLV